MTSPDTNEAGRSLKEVAREQGSILERTIRDCSLAIKPHDKCTEAEHAEAYGVACMKAALERAKKEATDEIDGLIEDLK